MYGDLMTHSNEFAILAQSIGESAVDYIGKDNLKALALDMNSSTFEGVVRVSLKNNSDAAQLETIRKFFELEELFRDEADLELVFCSNVEAVLRNRVGVKALQFA